MPILEKRSDPPFRVTMNVLKVMTVLYQDSQKQHYGLSLAQDTGLGDGTLYPILDKLEDLGLITGTWEEIDQSQAKRRRRRYYTLTGLGVRRYEEERAKVFAAPKGIVRV